MAQLKNKEHRQKHFGENCSCEKKVRLFDAIFQTNDNDYIFHMVLAEFVIVVVVFG